MASEWICFLVPSGDCLCQTYLQFKPALTIGKRIRHCLKVSLCYHTPPTLQIFLLISCLLSSYPCKCCYKGKARSDTPSPSHWVIRRDPKCGELLQHFPHCIPSPPQPFAWSRNACPEANPQEWLWVWHPACWFAWKMGFILDIQAKKSRFIPVSAKWHSITCSGDAAGCCASCPALRGPSRAWGFASSFPHRGTNRNWCSLWNILFIFSFKAFPGRLWFGLLAHFFFF